MCASHVLAYALSANANILFRISAKMDMVSLEMLDNRPMVEWAGLLVLVVLPARRRKHHQASMAKALHHRTRQTLLT